MLAWGHSSGCLITPVCCRVTLTDERAEVNDLLKVSLIPCVSREETVIRVENVFFNIVSCHISLVDSIVTDLDVAFVHVQYVLWLILVPGEIESTLFYLLFFILHILSFLFIFVSFPCKTFLFYPVPTSFINI